MSYTKINWKDAPDTSTPVNANNLNKMDAQIASNEQNITDLINTVDEGDIPTEISATGKVGEALSSLYNNITSLEAKIVRGRSQFPEASELGSQIVTIAFGKTFSSVPTVMVTWNDWNVETISNYCTNLQVPQSGITKEACQVACTRTNVAGTWSFSWVAIGV